MPRDKYIHVIVSDFGEAVASEDFIRGYAWVHHYAGERIPPRKEKALVDLVGNLCQLQRHFGGKGTIRLDKVLAAICEQEQEYPIP